MSILKKILGDPNEKYIKSLQPKVEEINALEKEIEGLKDEEIKERALKLKERAKEKELDNLLPEAFSLVREAAKRTLSQRHFDVQLMGGIALHQRKVAEMKTGEGKPLTATLPAFLNALKGEGVHLVTVNDYLAQRDTVWMGQIYDFLGLKVGCIGDREAFLYDSQFRPDPEADQRRDETGAFKVEKDFLRPCPREEAYKADITYGTNNQFGFDYLRDNTVLRKEDRVQRGFPFAIIDEVDSVLIDEARTPLIISSPETEKDSQMYREFSQIVPKLKKDKDYEIHEKEKAVTLTEEGIERVEEILNLENIYQSKGMKYLHYLEQSLRAETLFKKDVHYIIKDNQILIVDEFTGRIMPGRRWSGGLHQAIEAKEGLPIEAESRTIASITFQNYFRMYKKLSGMTGTAATSSEEFEKVYDMEVAVIPTNKPLIRKSHPDKFFRTEKGKFKAAVEEVKKRSEKGQPVLVGTVAVEKNELFSKMLKRAGVSHRVLNAKDHQKEGETIAQAGNPGAVTVATNMAGRGVDIILGGNPPKEEDAKRVKELGGLFVLGTERHEARRIDNQLRGRSGRQGDPGESQFFVSLEDDLLRIFGGERVESLMNTLKVPEDQPIESNFISNSIESAQKKVEGMHFDAREHVLNYDDVLNKHRQKFYALRNEILESDKEGIEKYVKEILLKQGYKEEDYKAKEEEVGEEEMIKIAKVVALRTMDINWTEHLESMDYIREAVRLRAYGQRDPLVEYKREGHLAFQEFLGEIEKQTAERVLKVTTSKIPSENVVIRKPVESKSEGYKKVKRNDPCPCGKIDPNTGKVIKYKKCHGKDS